MSTVAVFCSIALSAYRLISMHNWGKPEWAPPRITAGQNVCLSVCLYGTSSVRAKCMYGRACTDWWNMMVHISLNRSQPVPLYNCVQLATRILSLFECLKVHVLQSRVFHGIIWATTVPGTKSGWRSKCHRRSYDRGERVWQRAEGVWISGKEGTAL